MHCYRGFLNALEEMGCGIAGSAAVHGELGGLWTGTSLVNSVKALNQESMLLIRDLSIEMDWEICERVEGRRADYMRCSVGVQGPQDYGGAV